MAYRYTEEDLKKLNLEEVSPGVYQPRKDKTVASNRVIYHESSGHYPPTGSGDAKVYVKGSIGNLFPVEGPTMRKITLNLFGIPMPKQSVRSHANGSYKLSKAGKKVYNVMHYQPKEMKDNTAKGQAEIRKQLPEGFVPFSNEVKITKLQFVFPPLKAFQKIKGRMQDIHNGKVFKKNTKPDLDNTCKYTLDLLKGIVFTDDNIIVSINMEKVYGVGGATIIELEGW